MCDQRETKTVERDDDREAHARSNQAIFDRGNRRPTGPKLAKMLFTYLLADSARSFGFRTPNSGDKKLTWSKLV
jgi:hypothetical protein